MQENIGTISINEIFSHKKGCPFCRMYSMLESLGVEYILGNAMMQPDVRVVTNRLGFCRKHYDQMIGTGKRLQIALILQSHLKLISEEMIPDSVKGKPNKKTINAIKKLNTSCYVCEKISWGMDHLTKSVLSMWTKDEDFRKIFNEQEYFCLEHYESVLDAACSGEVSSRLLPILYNQLNDITSRYLNRKRNEIDEFCNSFDYRNAGKKMDIKPQCIDEAVSLLQKTNIE